MSLADEFDRIGGPLQKPLVPKKKPAPPSKAQADATAVKLNPPPIDAAAKEREIRASQPPITPDMIAALKMGKK
jgi:hypothetical protein